MWMFCVPLLDIGNWAPLLGLLWLGALLRIRRAGWLLAGIVAANAFAWLETNYPLQRIYAFGPSRDRVGNVALCVTTPSL